MTGSQGLTVGPGPSKPFDSFLQNSRPVALSRKRIGLLQPGGVSMLRSRLYTAGPQPRAISMVRVLKLRVLGCQEVLSCFSIRMLGTPKRASSSAAPRPTGPAPRMMTRSDSPPVTVAIGSSPFAVALHLSTRRIRYVLGGRRSVGAVFGDEPHATLTQPGWERARRRRSGALPRRYACGRIELSATSCPASS